MTKILQLADYPAELSLAQPSTAEVANEKQVTGIGSVALAHENQQHEVIPVDWVDATYERQPVEKFEDPLVYYDNDEDVIDFGEQTKEEPGAYEKWVPFNEILEAWDGDTMPVKQMNDGMTYVSGEARVFDYGLRANVLRKLGFVLNEEETEIIEAPVPRALTQSAKRFGVDIAFVRGGSELVADQYFGILAQKKWPVGAGSAYHYMHDTGDAHLSTVVLGGDVLMTELAAIAQRVPEEPDPKVKAEAALNTDFFLVALRFELERTTRGVNNTEMFKKDAEDFMGISGDKLDAIMTHSLNTLAPLQPSQELIKSRIAKEAEGWDELDPI